MPQPQPKENGSGRSSSSSKINETLKIQKQQMENLIKEYVAHHDARDAYRNYMQGDAVDARNELELEVRFGTRGTKHISKIDYDSVIQKLKSNGFTQYGSVDQTFLRMSPEYIDTRTGQTRVSNLRIEISGAETIQQYCRDNNMEAISQRENVTYTVKKPVSMNGEVVRPVDVDNWNYRLALSNEQRFSAESNVATNALATWKDSKKIFRLITRNSFTAKSQFHLFRVDLSVVRESARRGRFLQPAYTFQSSGVTDTIPKYEIEIEIIPISLYRLSTHNRAKELHTMLRSNIMLILSALQKTNYPISYPEQKGILQDYMKIIHGVDPEKEKGKENDKSKGKDAGFDENKRITPRDFIGPSSYTLSINNVAVVNPDATIPNIREGYTVTDKADGERKLLVVGKEGKIYLIDTNMNVQFTGAITEEKTLFNSILDGEHILHDKTGRFINLYAVFDLYFINKKDVRALPFIAPREIKESVAQTDLVKQYRHSAMEEFVSRLGLKSVVARAQVSPLRINVKTFYNADDRQNIFQCCGMIMNKVRDGLFEYETDGLIFTPGELGVGMNTTSGKETVKNTKITWDYSFKWKPTEFNTIDFLVSTKKTDNGVDAVGNIFQNGVGMDAPNSLVQYKTLILRVGFDEKKHGYINPCQDMIDDKYKSASANASSSGDKDDDTGYRPVQFVPTNPYDPEAGICNMTLQGSLDNRVMMTEEGEVFGDNTIVEFRYDIDREHGWRWIPLRVRYDKTADYLAKGRNYGNAYHVANSNWNSIHNPITERMITTGVGIPDVLEDDEIYYNRTTSDSSTRGLRDFHNLYVKKLLITKTAKRGGTIIDMAAGKAGDMPKWIAAKAAFVFGVDIAKDNIENRLDGACARYLNYRRKLSTMPDALFVHGDSTANIRNGDAMYTDKGKQIVRAIFGQGPKDEGVLGKGVMKQFGRGVKGFDLTTIQFSFHYMFKNQQTLQNTMRNISECTKIGGYFISTQYDGRTVFNKLRKLQEGEALTIMENGKKIWEVTKKYDQTEFDDDATSVGYAIDVYQETINKVFTEYLVNYNYVVQLMEDYGFVPMEREEARRMGFKGSSGMFEELFDMMRNEIKRARDDPDMNADYGTAIDMTEGEKRISFLNRWMIFKKVRDVDAAAVARNLMGMSFVDEVDGREKRILSRQEQQQQQDDDDQYDDDQDGDAKSKTKSKTKASAKSKSKSEMKKTGEIIHIPRKLKRRIKLTMQ